MHGVASVVLTATGWIRCLGSSNGWLHELKFLGDEDIEKAIGGEADMVSAWRSIFSTRAARSAASHHMQRSACGGGGGTAELGLEKGRSMVRAFSSALAADADLRSNSLGSEGARMLVESLKRHPCSMTLQPYCAACVAELLRCLSLRPLDLSDNSIEDLGAKSLAESLGNHSGLKVNLKEISSSAEVLESFQMQ